MRRTNRTLIAALAFFICAFALSPRAAWQPGKRGLVNFKFFIPDTSAAGTKFPLVLYLHPNGWQGNIDSASWGGGNKGLNNIDKDTLPSVLSRPDSQAHHPCFVLAPECPSQVPGKTTLGCWLAYSTNWDLGWDPNRYTYSISDSSLCTQQLKDVLRALDSLCARYARIDTNRLHIAGGSMGGNATMYLICRYPGRFASATAIAFNGDTSHARDVIGTPMWLFWGDSDPTVAWQGDVLMKDAIVKAGGHPNFIQFSGTGHLWNQVWCYDQPTYYQPGLIPWMLSQSKVTTVVGDRSRTQTGSPQFAEVALRGRMIVVRADVPATVTLFQSTGRVIAQVATAPRAPMSLPLPMTKCGVIYISVSHGAQQFVRSFVAPR